METVVCPRFYPILTSCCCYLLFFSLFLVDVGPSHRSANWSGAADLVERTLSPALSLDASNPRGLAMENLSFAEVTSSMPIVSSSPPREMPVSGSMSSSPMLETFRIPIIRMKGIFIVSIQMALDDALVLQLKEDVAATIAREGGRGLIVDVSGIDTSLLGHTYYGDNDTVITDIVQLLCESKPPGLRDRLRARVRNGLEYWEFLTNDIRRCCYWYYLWKDRLFLLLL